jgi:hypothetical protein
MSPKVSPNFDQEVSPMKPGVYLCKIIAAEVNVGKDSGNQYINWRLETLPDQRTVFYTTPTQGKGAGMFKHFVHSAGDKQYQNGDYELDNLRDKIVSMKLEIEAKNNRDGNPIKVFRVVDVSPPTFKQLEEMRKDQDDIPF